ncbi:MAG: hypothetical protein SFU86_13665 [Pirellulaceae bacterium]|nr:hypothetical protein [Pirellulaceae bacterium]
MRKADRGLRIAGVAIVLGALTLSTPRAEEPPPPFTLETYRGQVGFLAEMLEKKYGVTSVPEAKDKIIAIQTADGRLVPLVENIRGRAFRRDDRLRNPEVELLVRRYAGSPAVQVIRVYEIAPDGKYEIDYWCDICAIAMYELKDCECCQGEIALRRTKVK